MMCWPLRTWCLLAWGIVLIGVTVAVLRPHKGGKLYPTFATAGEHFWHGEPLYGDVPEHLDQFRYSPMAAFLLGPWHQLPLPVGHMLWRVGQALFFLLMLRAWARTAEPGVPWPALALLALPLVAGNIFNAQANLLVGGLLLAGLVALHRGAMNLAAVAVAVAVLFKIYPLAVGLLFTLIEPRRFGVRFLVVLLSAIGLLFLVREPAYLQEQFVEWWERVATDDRTEQPIQKGYHDFQKLLRCWGVHVTLRTYRVIEVVVGVGFGLLLLCQRWQGIARPELLHRAYYAGSIWMTLFGPATESATYMLLAAPVSYEVYLCCRMRAIDPWRACCMVVVYVLFLSVPIALWFPRPVSDPYRTLIPQAHAALLFLLHGLLVFRSPRPKMAPT